MDDLWGVVLEVSLWGGPSWRRKGGWMGLSDNDQSVVGHFFLAGRVWECRVYSDFPKAHALAKRRACGVAAVRMNVRWSS